MYALIENCRGELVDGTRVQTEDELLSAPDVHYAASHALMREILSYLVDGPSGRPLPRRR